MQKAGLWALLAVLAFGAGVARANSTSYTGTLASPESTVEIALTLMNTSDVTLQTYGFGGGVNALGTTIVPGGTDPFVAIFSGTGASATMVTDASNNPFGTSLDLSNYSSFVGCPPAHAVADFGSTTCGDVKMTLDNLAAGRYTVVLSDGQYIANAVFDNGTLGEGFADFTAVSFCNLVDSNTGSTCPNTIGAYALDVITSSSTPPPVPEPASPTLLLAGLLGAASMRRRDIHGTRFGGPSLGLHALRNLFDLVQSENGFLSSQTSLGITYSGQTKSLQRKDIKLDEDTDASFGTFGGRGHLCGDRSGSDTKNCTRHRRHPRRGYQHQRKSCSQSGRRRP